MKIIEFRIKHLGYLAVIISMIFISLNIWLIVFVKKNMTNMLDPVIITSDVSRVYFDPNKSMPSELDRVSVYGDKGSELYQKLRDETKSVAKNAKSELEKKLNTERMGKNAG